MRHLGHLVILILCGTYFFVSKADILEDKIFIFQNPPEENNKTVLVVTWSHEEGGEKAVDCEIFINPRLIEEVIKASHDELIHKPSEQEIKVIIEECTEISRRRRREIGTSTKRSISWRRNRENFFRRGRRINPERDSSVTENLEDEESSEVATPEGYNSLPVIFPGTKWCGADDLAKNYDDLGFHQDTDRCCRAHDLCNDTMAPGETKNDLKNGSPFTKLSCTCDNDFYNCLDRVNTITSNTVGNMYFNILKRDCYALDYPLTDKCKKHKTFLKLICVEYQRDTKAKKVFQWVSAKKYRKIPIPVIGVMAFQSS